MQTRHKAFASICAALLGMTLAFHGIVFPDPRVLLAGIIPGIIMALYFYPKV